MVRRVKSRMSQGTIQKAPSYPQAPAGPTPTKVVNRNLIATSPNREQFEPKEGQPVRAHYKMAGGA